MVIPSPRAIPRSPLAEWWKIIAMGVLLAGLVWLAFFHEPQRPTTGPGAPTQRAIVAVPEIDAELLQTAADATHTERLVLEPEPYAHLLESSVHVVPTVAEALGRPAEPVPLSVLRAAPGSYRGAYLWYAGELKHLSPPKSGHPVAGYSIYEGWIETSDGEIVMFRTSLPFDGTPGEYVRVEGFFLKLRDSITMPAAERAPLLVGPELYRDFRRWPPVTSLDPAVFASIRDGIYQDGEWIDEQDIEADLEESQDVPLWTLASYALHRAASPDDTLAAWRKVPAFVDEKQFEQIKAGTVERGTPFRLLGTYVMGHWFAARPNPVGIEHWTRAWIQVRDLGGKTIPVWLPTKITNIAHGQPLEVRGYYFRRFAYESLRPREVEGYLVDAKVVTPLFVAARLDDFETGEEHPAAAWMKYAFFGIVLFVIALFFVVARRDRLARDEHERTMIERRRRHRAQAAGAAARSDA